MDSLVFKGNNGQVVTNSLLVAEKFGKRHANVIRDIEKLLNTEDTELNSKMSLAFVIDTYEDSTGKSNPVYIMNRKGFSILVMGYNGIKALRFKNPHRCLPCKLTSTWNMRTGYPMWKNE